MAKGLVLNSGALAETSAAGTFDVPGTLKTNTIDTPSGSLTIGGTTATGVTIGRSGQTLTLAGSAPALNLAAGAASPTTNGEVRYVTDTGFKFYEEGTVSTLLSATGKTKLDSLTYTAAAGQTPALLSFGGTIESTAGGFKFPDGSTQTTAAAGSASAAGGSGAIQFASGTSFAADATNLFWDDTNNRLGVGTNTPATALDVNGVASVTSVTLPHGTVRAVTLTTSTAAQGQVLDSISASSYRSVKYEVQVTSGSAYHVTEIRVLHNGSDAYVTEYGTMMTGNSLATFTADINGGNLRLLTSPENAVTVYKILAYTISA